MAYEFQVTIDCAEPHVLADWWATALGWQVERPDEEFIQRMVDEGHATAADTTRHQGRLAWREGAAVHNPGRSDAPRIYFQQVPEPKTVKNRLHLDLRIGDDDLSTVVERLKGAGATWINKGSQGAHVWVTMADPEGNEFCLSA